MEERLVICVMVKERAKAYSWCRNPSAGGAAQGHWEQGWGGSFSVAGSRRAQWGAGGLLGQHLEKNQASSKHQAGLCEAGGQARLGELEVTVR